MKERATIPAVERTISVTFPSSMKYKVALAKLVRDFEREYLAGLLLEQGNNIRAASRASGLNRSTLYRMLLRSGDYPEWIK